MDVAAVKTPTLVAPLEVKPRLRGWFHLVTTPIALVGGLILLIAADTVPLRIACAVWTLTAIMLFGNSAAYHRGQWSERVLEVLRRIDHSNIAIFIAGTYTPLAVALLSGGSRVTLLSLIWGIAALDVSFRVLWMGAPRWLYVGLYLVMGWCAVFWMPQMWSAGGPAAVILLIAGGLFYSAGAVVYALKRPNPNPEWFGFHEIFHAGTVLGAACHWAAILIAVR
ncbi:hemolysin III family protein [Brooklawnia sp.]|uniref:PAQR family membrane homeostasis protein TrhA n=1 Tax=Brooklawnia sp. TaxID=2699740 RepID=UPI00311D8FBE